MFSGRIHVYDEQTREISLLQCSGSSIRKTPQAVHSIELLSLINHSDCPKYIQMRVREFLRTMNDFKTYLNYPELNLPVTTNTVETMIRLLRNLLKHIHGARTPHSFLCWTKTYIRQKKTIACNGKKSTELIP
jgi:hypothetical protein